MDMKKTEENEGEQVWKGERLAMRKKQTAVVRTITKPAKLAEYNLRLHPPARRHIIVVSGPVSPLRPPASQRVSRSVRFGYSSKRYIGKESEGNIYITDSDL